MNRIYQGKVTGVEIQVPANKENPWQPFDADHRTRISVGLGKLLHTSIKPVPQLIPAAA